MLKILQCRRSTLALLAVGCLTFLGAYIGDDISGIAIAISGIVASVSGANAWEKRAKDQYKTKEEDK